MYDEIQFMRTNLTQPEVTGYFSTDTLAEIGEQYPNRLTGAEWYSKPSKNRRCSNPELLKMVEPITQLILDNRLGFGIKKPDAIYFEVQTGLDHKSTRESAHTKTYKEMRSAARLLINSANIQAYQFDFNLEESFNARLASLRIRFGIPDPEEI